MKNPEQIFIIFLLAVIAMLIGLYADASYQTLEAIRHETINNGNQVEMLRGEIAAIRRDYFLKEPPITNVYQMEVFGHINLVDPNGNIIKEDVKIKP